MLVLGILLFLWIRLYGIGLTAPLSHDKELFGLSKGPVHTHSFMHVLLALMIILIGSRLVGALFRYFHQPAVVGEVLAGILLGPSLFGHLAPGAFATVFPPSIQPLLQVIAKIGVVLFMFLVGLELNTGKLRARAHAALAISHASILCPFLLGSGLALILYPRLSTQDVPFTAFALFMGVSMSVTAFPVLARILTDRRLQRSRMGTIAMTCAAIDDVTAWCLLAFVVGVIQSRLNGAAQTVLLTVVYIVCMFVVVRPLVKHLVLRYEQGEGSPQTMMALVCIGLLLSALTTSSIGIHSLFGAFLLGSVIPANSLVARTLTGKLEDFVTVLLLPAFFAFTGLRTQIGLISGAQWLLCLLIILVAFAGKFGGSSLAARATGLSWRDASALGVLMNTRGLMELIVLNIGLDLKVISPTLFAMLVIMALVTTFTTTPLMDLLGYKEEPECSQEPQLYLAPVQDTVG